MTDTGRKPSKVKHRCSVPDCREQTKADLILSKRRLNPLGEYVTSGRLTVKHVYLCAEHYEEMLKFLDFYGGD